MPGLQARPPASLAAGPADVILTLITMSESVNTLSSQCRVRATRHSARGEMAMRKLVIVAASVLAMFALPAASIALASPASGHRTAKPHPPMNISFMSGPDSAAHWTPRQQAVLLRVGADSGSFAEIVVHHFPAAAPSQEPSFTNVGPGSPVLVISFAGGGFVEEAAGGGSSAWT